MERRVGLRRLFAIGVLVVTAAGCSAVSSGDVSGSGAAAPRTTSPVTTATSLAVDVAPVVPAPPHAATRAGAPGVFVVGDSLTVGTEPWLDGAIQARGWRLTAVDARTGRTVPEGLAVLRRRARAGTLPPTVIVALGTNNLGASAADVESWVASARAIVGDERQLGWVNVSVAEPRSPERAREIDDDLAASARRWNVEILDWYGWTRRNGITNKPDGIHYEDGVYRLRALFYAAALPKVLPTTAAATITAP